MTIAELEGAKRICEFYERVFDALGVTQEQLDALPDDLGWSYQSLVDLWRGDD